VVVAVIAHDHGAGIAPSDEAVVFAAVDLHLVLVEGVDQVAGDHTLGQGIAVRGLQRERRVGQAGDGVFTNLVGLVIDDLFVLDQAAPHLR